MRRLGADHGFTLSELVVVTALLGIILGVAWLGYSVTSAGSRLSDRESSASEEISIPLLEAERLVMQQYYIRTGTFEGRVVNPGPYLLAFDTDRDNDGNNEVNIIEATADNRLVFHRLEAVDSPTLSSYAYSIKNYNQDAGIPLFTYYASDGSEIVDANLYASQARSVKITIVTEQDGKRFSDSRTISFRKQ